MPDNRSTDHFEAPDLDCEDWDIAFAPYTKHPDCALILAFHLTVLLDYLQGEIRDIPEAIAAIDRAIHVLYKHTDFHRVSRELYRVAITGKLDPKQEKLLGRLGVRI